MKINNAKVDPLKIEVEFIENNEYWIRYRVSMFLFWLIDKVGIVKTVNIK